MSSTFTIQSSTTVVYLSKPVKGGENKSIVKNLKLFDFWDNDRENVDIDINSQPLVLEGWEKDEFKLCFPFCFPTRHLVIENKFNAIWAIMESHDEIEISGLGDEYDGTYVIRSFNFNHIKGWFKWRLELEEA